jgi:hypothetical protein
MGDTRIEMSGFKKILLLSVFIKSSPNPTSCYFKSQFCFSPLHDPDCFGHRQLRFFRFRGRVHGRVGGQLGRRHRGGRLCSATQVRQPPRLPFWHLRSSFVHHSILARIFECVFWSFSVATAASALLQRTHLPCARPNRWPRSDARGRLHNRCKSTKYNNRWDIVYLHFKDMKAAVCH